MTVITEHPPSDIQKKHMAQARFMLSFWDKYAPIERNYAFIKAKLIQSRDKAGGPALRLANCVWDLEYALRFPKTKTLTLREEASFAGLFDDKGAPIVDPKWYVGEAIQEFLPLRQEYREQIPMSMLGKENLVLPKRQQLVKIFWLLHTTERTGYVDKIIMLFLEVNPEQQAHFIPYMRTIAEAVYAWETRRKDLKQKLARMSSLWRTPWIGQTEIGDAMTAFQQEINLKLGRT